ncbi:MAG: transposase family protein [Saprospiraceae bacterium]
MNYKEIRKRARQFESVTSLKVEEFDHLLAIFSDKWRNYYRIHTIEGKRRNAPLMKPEKPTKSLPSTAESFFILVYLKNYALQEMTAASFGFSQGQASKWQKALRPLLHESLKSLDVLPTRRGTRLRASLINWGDPLLSGRQRTGINRPPTKRYRKVFSAVKKRP